MEKEDAIIYITDLCKKNKLSNDDIKNSDIIFSNNIIKPNYDEGCFILIASYSGNLDMLRVLKNNNADLSIENNKALRLAAQGNYNECVTFLYNNITKPLNFYEFEHTKGYDNLKKIIPVLAQ